MKKLLFIFVLSIILAGCGDDNNDPSLPAISQTGARTFGCLINGKVFAYKGEEITCYYTIAEQNFSISAQNLNRNPRLVWLGTFSKDIVEGETYQLNENTAFNAWASCRFKTPDAIAEFASTNSNYTGEMTITKLDFENNIVSGTFWFDLQHPVSGETVEIREGRFDTVFIEQ